MISPLEYKTPPYNKGSLYKHQSLERDIYNKVRRSKPLRERYLNSWAKLANTYIAFICLNRPAIAGTHNGLDPLHQQINLVCITDPDQKVLLVPTKEVCRQRAIGK